MIDTITPASEPAHGYELPWETEMRQAAAAGDIARAMAVYIARTDYVSFAELESHLAPFFPMRGDVAMFLPIPGHGEVLLWMGWSQAAVDAVKRLRASGAIAVEPSVFLVYLIDGKALTLPIAKRPPKGGYKTLHWLPVTLRPASRAAKNDRRKGATR